MELWKVVLDYLRRSPAASEPWGRDRGRVEEVLAQLYILGERPAVDDVRECLLASQGRWQREIVALWRKRTRRPSHCPRSVGRDGGGWAYPFVIPELVAAKHGLVGVAERLTAAVSDAAREYIRLAKEDPGGESARTAGELYSLTTRAVRLWVLSQDRVDDMPWPSVTARRGPRDNLFEQWTRTGRARHRAELDGWRHESEEEMTRIRQEHEGE